MIALAAVGVFDGALGVAWPSMRVTFDQPLAALGVVLLAYTGGYFVTSFAGGWLLERVGTGMAMVGVATSAVVGASLFAISPGWPVVLAGSVLLGASGGAADLTLNHELAQHHGVRALGFLHAAWGLGAASGPLVVTAFVAGGRTWRLAFVPIVVFQAGLLIAYLVVRRDWEAVPRRDEEPDDAEPLDRVALVLALALFLLYVGVESGAGQWGFTLFTEGRGMPERTAGVWMSSYWLSLTGGRLVVGMVGHRYRPDALLTASVLGAVLSAAVVAWDPLGAGVVAMAPLGFSLAAVFPVLVAVTPERLGAHRAARALGMQIAVSAVGGVGIPSVMGLGAQAWGVDALAPMLAIGAAALAVVHAVALRRRPSTPR
jgi:fucose permease